MGDTVSIKKKKRTLTVIAIVITVVLIVAAILIARGNTALEVNTYNLTHKDVPESFNGFRIAQISDLHDAEIGKDNERLIKALEEAKPDIIVMTGDMIDSRRINIDRTLCFVNSAVNIAPCYYVTGNHESRISEYPSLREGMIEAGVTVLENERTEIFIGDDKISILGIHDPLFSDTSTDRKAVTREYLDSIADENDGFTLLLAHRPEVFDVYVEYSIDLALTGHVHGGQFRIPFLGGLYVPNQGFFPEYDAGLYAEGDTNMFISRGIGNSAFPFRINNRPEIVVIELESE